MRVMFLKILLSISLCPHLWAHPDSSSALKKGERLFAEQLYGDALPLYSLLLPESNENLAIPLTLQLATCFLKEQQPLQVLTLLSPLDTLLYHNQTFYLMSLAYRQLKQTPQALALLQHCTSTQNPHNLSSFIALERAYHLTHLGDLSQAQLILANIPWQPSSPLPYGFAQLQLAKIQLMTQQFQAAHQTLRTLRHLDDLFTFPHPLAKEKIYLTGWLYLAQQQDAQALTCFEQLLPYALASQTDTTHPILQGAIISCLRQALSTSSVEQARLLLSQADHLLSTLLLRFPTEHSYLLRLDYLLIKAKRLNDSHAYAQAQDWLHQQDLFPSLEGQRLAKLKQAEAAPSYQERDLLYQQLTSDLEETSPFYAKAWFLKGWNDFNEGLKFQKKQKSKEAQQHFKKAAQAFSQATTKHPQTEAKEIALAMKYQALAEVYQADHAQQAWLVLMRLLADATLLAACESPQEIHCLAGWIALHLTEETILRQAQVLLHQGAAIIPANSWNTLCHKIEGLILLQLEEWSQADALFAQLLQDNSACGEAWFWRAYIAEHNQQPDLKKEYLQYVYQQDPQSPYAPVAYFHFYTYRDYVQGQRKAVKHLQAMPLLFPSHPLLITAHYLRGLDYKKDRYSEEGQLLRRKDWIAAIEAFQLAESTFETLFANQLIPITDLSYFLPLYHRAQLERALANLAIGKQSTGGKRQIYLEYAEGVFKHLILQLTNDSKIRAEAEFRLAQIYKEKEEWDEMEKILEQSLAHHQQAQTTPSYWLMRVWNEKGQMAQRKAAYQQALTCFMEAEKASHHLKSLHPDEKLDIWIQQSVCYKRLHQLDDAMRLLSRVINDDVISALRIKAMLLRAEIYELQGRPELALKQLEATARKGGEWAREAQAKLEKMYGY